MHELRVLHTPLHVLIGADGPLPYERHDWADLATVNSVVHHGAAPVFANVGFALEWCDLVTWSKRWSAGLAAQLWDPRNGPLRPDDYPHGLAYAVSQWFAGPAQVLLFEAHH